MAVCGQCGAQAKDEAKFCPSCGATIAAQAAPAAGYSVPVAGAPLAADPDDAQKNKVMAILAYLIFFIPLLTGDYKTSPFVKFHTNQGTVLFLGAIAYGIVYMILAAILAFIPFIGWLIALLLGFCYLVVPVLAILGIVNAVKETMKPLPIIGGFSIIK